MAKTIDYYANEALPDIEMFGGDTSEWHIPLFNPDGSGMKYSAVQNCAAVLRVVRYDLIYEYDDGIAADIALIKTGTIGHDSEGNAEAVFAFEQSDTADMKGKYIYQVTVIAGSGTGGVNIGTITPYELTGTFTVTKDCRIVAYNDDATYPATFVEFKLKPVDETTVEEEMNYASTEAAKIGTTRWIRLKEDVPAGTYAYSFERVITDHDLYLMTCAFVDDTDMVSKAADTVNEEHITGTITLDETGNIYILDTDATGSVTLVDFKLFTGSGEEVPDPEPYTGPTPKDYPLLVDTLPAGEYTWSFDSITSEANEALRMIAVYEDEETGQMVEKVLGSPLPDDLTGSFAIDNAVDLILRDPDASTPLEWVNFTLTKSDDTSIETEGNGGSDGTGAITGNPLSHLTLIAEDLEPGLYRYDMDALTSDDQLLFAIGTLTDQNTIRIDIGDAVNQEALTGTILIPDGDSIGNYALYFWDENPETQFVCEGFRLTKIGDVDEEVGGETGIIAYGTAMLIEANVAPGQYYYTYTSATGDQNVQMRSYIPTAGGGKKDIVVIAQSLPAGRTVAFSLSETRNLELYNPNGGMINLKGFSFIKAAAYHMNIGPSTTIVEGYYSRESPITYSTFTVTYGQIQYGADLVWKVFGPNGNQVAAGTLNATQKQCVFTITESGSYMVITNPDPETQAIIDGREVTLTTTAAFALQAKATPSVRKRAATGLSETANYITVASNVAAGKYEWTLDALSSERNFTLFAQYVDSNYTSHENYVSQGYLTVRRNTESIL